MEYSEVEKAVGVKTTRRLEHKVFHSACLLLPPSRSFVVLLRAVTVQLTLCALQMSCGGFTRMEVGLPF